jgi:hypothetical protein
MNYQEAGQLSDDYLKLWDKAIFGEKPCGSDSKTGRYVCIHNRQKPKFAYFLIAIEAKF